MATASMPADNSSRVISGSMAGYPISEAKIAEQAEWIRELMYSILRGRDGCKQRKWPLTASHPIGYDFCNRKHFLVPKLELGNEA
jgi:hypothetical protein